MTFGTTILVLEPRHPQILEHAVDRFDFRRVDGKKVQKIVIEINFQVHIHGRGLFRYLSFTQKWTNYRM